MTNIQQEGKLISRDAKVWLATTAPIYIVTIINGIKYYENPRDPDGPFCAVINNRVYETPYYGLDELERLG